MANYVHITPTPCARRPAGAVASATGATDRRQAPSRRSLLTSGTALLLSKVAATPAFAAPPHQDAELTRLGAQLTAAWARQRAFFAAHPWTDDATTHALIEPARLAARQMLRVRASTWEELRMKALAVSWCRDGEDMESSTGTTDSRLLWSIVHDLLRLNSGAA